MHRAEEVFDEMLIPTLSFAKRDFLRNQLSEEDHKLVLDGVQTSLWSHREVTSDDRSTERRRVGTGDGRGRCPGSCEVKPVKLLICPAADASDSVAIDNAATVAGFDPLGYRADGRRNTDIRTGRSYRVESAGNSVHCNPPATRTGTRTLPVQTAA